MTHWRTPGTERNAITVGSAWHDRRQPARRLVVESYTPRERSGREVVGVLRFPGDPTNSRQYTTDLTTFRKIWVPDD